MAKTLDPIIQTERRLALLRQIRGLLTDDPSSESVLRDALNLWTAKPETDGKAVVSRPSKSAHGTLFDRTVQLFRERGNPWMTSTEIREQTGNKSRGSIGVMLYKTNEDAFEVRDHPGNRKQKQWRLRETKGGEHDG